VLEILAMTFLSETLVFYLDKKTVDLTEDAEASDDDGDYQ